LSRRVVPEHGTLTANMTAKGDKSGTWKSVAMLFIMMLLASQLEAQIPADSEIRTILAERVDKYRQGVGFVVGVIEPQGRRVIAYGKLAAGDSRILNGDTLFEIGSVTKVFTSLVLADMVERGELALLDPVSKFLPQDIRVPARRGQQITLQDLATHTSGLPRNPLNVISPDPSNPFAEYSADRLYEFLRSYELPRLVGARFEYSNLGGALLGHALERRAGMSYEELVKTRIAKPLGMQSTHISLTPEARARLATGHAYGLEPTPNWDLGALAGAGAFRSTVNDLLAFLAANLGYTETSLAPAMSAMLKVRRETSRDRPGEVGLAWLIDTHGGVEIISHGGGTGGYQSFIGYDRKARTGVVVLSNSGTGAGVEDIGIHLLNPKVPLLSSNALAAPKPRTEVTVDPRVLESYVGRYEFPSGQMAHITREGGRLFLQAEGDVRVTFHAESDRSFFARLMDAQITFQMDRRGRVSGMTFVRNGSSAQVPRIE
jgi:D-alanyl-D-alanine-carboxypeptidase/D-alanyl-D-alanine-endopeptidase